MCSIITITLRFIGYLNLLYSRFVGRSSQLSCIGVAFALAIFCYCTIKSLHILGVLRIFNDYKIQWVTLFRSNAFDACIY